MELINLAILIIMHSWQLYDQLRMRENYALLAAFNVSARYTIKWRVAVK